MIPVVFLPNMFHNGHLTAKTELCPQTAEEQKITNKSNAVLEYEVVDCGTLTQSVRKIFFSIRMLTRTLLTQSAT